MTPNTPVLRNIALHGSPLPPDQPKALAAGELTLSYCNGELRNCALGGVEIVRRIYVAVRDKYWNTTRPEILGLSIRRTPASFHIEFGCRHRRDTIDFAWQATIEGDHEGAVSFALEGKALSTFETNRIGFCVLLPLKEWKSIRCKAELTNGTRVAGRFPGKLISPHQPLKDLRALHADFGARTTAELRFEGDTFEMEDQRNWTDASFKMYCPPLTSNIPFHVKKGDFYRQRIVLRVSSKAATPVTPRAASENAARFSRKSYAIPEMGTSLRETSGPLSAQETSLIGACGFSHLRANIRFDTAGASRALAMAARNARAVNLPLELALYFRKDARSIGEDARILAAVAARVSRVLLFRSGEKATSLETVAKFRDAARRILRTAGIVAGTDGYFVEINRNKPAWRSAQGICYSVNPQVHTFDDAVIIDNLEGQYDALLTARHRYPGKAIIVSPVTLRPRRNPSAPRKDHGPDNRQKSLLGGVWTLGSIIRSAMGGASSVTYFETAGESGIMEQGGRRVFPLFHVIADVNEFAGGRLRPLELQDRNSVDGCVLEKAGRRRYLVANTTPDPRTVVLRRVPRNLRMRRLDAGSFNLACAQPHAFRKGGRKATAAGGACVLRLPAYAVATLDAME
jgi:D-apionolactonase